MVRATSPATDSEDNEVTAVKDVEDVQESQEGPGQEPREWQATQPDSTQREDEEVDVCEIDA